MCQISFRRWHLVLVCISLIVSKINLGFKGLLAFVYLGGVEIPCSCPLPIFLLDCIFLINGFYMLFLKSLGPCMCFTYFFLSL